ncbi:MULTISPECIES: hypothetical protein [Streptococcus]|uniref:hypothetical protein n=1 Tax=Streptococcus TaxID=1301 RepID=UPI001021CC6E|nr:MULTISPECIES: hypothetical protein [unclassified Streptococcus]MTQ41934.1 hypothetical protein [Streptococcus sp. BIOML-A1]RYS61190.1 hypothetical protein EAI95_04460 [Streptococcus sp. bf_0095]
MQEKNNASLVMGILSIILAFVFPLLGPILGILGLVLASSNQRESGLDYTTEKILSILGIVLSVVMFIVIISQLSGIN